MGERIIFFGPFDIGDILYVADFNTGANEEVLGVITEFTKDGDGDLEIKYVPNRAVGAGLTAAAPTEAPSASADGGCGCCDFAGFGGAT